MAKQDRIVISPGDMPPPASYKPTSPTATLPPSTSPVAQQPVPQTLSVATDGKPVNLPGVPHPVPQYAVLPPEMKSDIPLNFEQNVLRAQIKQGLATKTIDETEAVKRLNALIQKQALAQYGVTGSWLNKLVAGASTTAEYAIPGLIVAAKDPAAAGKAVYGSFKETVTDPVGQFKNDPFSFFTNAFALASGGAGAAARVGAVGRTVAGAAARDLPTALGALSKADKRAFAAVHKANGPVDSFGFNLDVADVPTVNRILKPSVKLQDVISKDPEFAKLHSQTVDLIQKGQIGTGVVNRGAAVRAVGASLPAQVLKSAIKTPVPKQRTLSVGGMVVNPPSYRNTLTNEALRLYDKAVTQRRLDRVYGTPGSTPGSIIPESVGNVWGPAAKVGRESAEAQKILNQVANAAGERLAFYGPSVPARVAGKAGSKAVMSRGTLLPRQTMRLSAIEQKVIDIVGGTGASFDEHIQSHTNDVQRWKDEAAQIQTDLSSGTGDVVKLGKRLKLVEKYATSSMDQAILSAAAKKIYENPRPVLARAIEGVRIAATKAEQAKIDLPGDISLSSESAAFRIGARTEQIKASAKGTESKLEKIKRISSFIHKDNIIKQANADEKAAIKSGKLKVKEAIKNNLDAVKKEEVAANKFFDLKTKLTASEKDLLAQIKKADKLAKSAWVMREKVRDRYDQAKGFQRLYLRQETIFTHMSNGFDDGSVSAGDLGRAQDRLASLKKQYEKVAGVIVKYENGETLGAEAQAAQDTLESLLNVARKSASAEIRKAELEWQRAFVERGKTEFPVDAARKDLAASVDSIAAKLKSDIESIPGQVDALKAELADLGGSLASKGVFYIPQKEKAASGFKNVKITKSKYGISVRPTGKAFENKGYTGELQRRGTFRTDVTQLTREQYKQVTRWVNIKRGLDTFLQSPDIDPTSKYAVAVRTDAPIPDDLKNAIDNIHRGNITRKEEKLLDEKVVEYLKSILPSRGSVFPGEPGIRYVDSRFGKSVLSQMNVPGSAPIRDTLNGIARGGLLYTKPAYYIANAMQTLGTNVGRQGVFAPVNWTSALRLASKLGEDDAAKILNLTHEGFFSTFDPGRGPLAGALGAASHFGNTLTDRIPRIAAWLHEARAEGFNTTETIHELLSNPKYNDKLIDISRRANNESVPYGDLTPFEQNQIKRTIFFYPWIRASAVYTMRFPFEHPFQTAAYNALAQEAQNEITNLFDGKIPAYLEGLVHVGGGKFILPKNVNNFNSLGEMVKAVDGLMPGGNPEYALNLASSLVPSLQFGISALTGRSSFGYKYPDGTSGLSGAIQDQWRSQPLVVLFGRVFGKQVDPTDPTNSPIVPRDPMTTGGRYVLGPSLFPTKVNQAGVISRAEKTKLDSMHGEKKISYSYDLQNAELDLWNEKRLQTGTGLSNAALDSIKRGLGLQRQRDIEFLKVSKKDAPVDRARQRFNLMLKVFVDNGLATQQQVDVVSQRAASATLDQVEKAASSFWSAVPDIRSLSLYTSAVNAEAGMAK